MQAYKDFYDDIEDIFEMLDSDEVNTYWDYLKNYKLKAVCSSKTMKKGIDRSKFYQYLSLLQFTIFIQTLNLLLKNSSIMNVKPINKPIINRMTNTLNGD